MAESSRRETHSRRADQGPRSDCPIASTLDVIGDRWTLLVARDLIAGKTRFSEFLASDERIPTNVLADRIRRLERHGIIDSVLYSQHPPRAEYHLTAKGRDLEPVLKAVGVWGLKHIPGTVNRIWGDSRPHGSRSRRHRRLQADQPPGRQPTPEPAYVEGEPEGREARARLRAGDQKPHPSGQEQS